jgi:hypothetical protein
MSDKHTRGPWMTLPEESDKPYVRIRGSVPGSRFKIANVLKPIYEGATELEAEETRANACLIESAPDLLATLQDLLEAYCSLMRSEFDFPGRPWTPERDNDTDALAALAAIAKAKGAA